MVAKVRTLGLRLRAVDKMSRSINRVQKLFPKLTRSVKRASRASQIFNQHTRRMRDSLNKVGGKLKSFGRSMTFGVTLPLTAAGVAAVKLFGDFQQGARGIEKTTGLSRKSSEALADTFDKLSTRIPVSTMEMLELAKSAGQLGVKGADNIEKFTVTMAKMSRASDVAGEEGAKSIARILTVTGDGIGKVDRFSSALVDLGNNAAAGETEILEVANRVAGQIGRFDVASASVLGISTALRALGKRAESSGSVIGRSFDAIDQAIKKGGQTALFLSKLTGIAVDKLKVQFDKDAAGVFRRFVVGLSKVEKGEGNLIKTFGVLGLEGIRINDILGTLAKRPEVLAINMDRASKAFRENTALQKEFLTQTQSFNSEMILVVNTLKRLLKLVGRDLAPAVKFFGNILKGIFTFLNNNPTIRTLVVIFAGFAAILGPVLFLLGGLLTSFLAIKVAALFLGIALAPIAIIALKVGLAIATLVTVSVLLIKNWERIKLFMATNPFGPQIEFIGFVINAMGKFIALTALAIANLDRLGVVFGIVKEEFGFGAPEPARFGPPRGTFNRDTGPIAPAPNFTPISGQIGVTFENAPPGTNVRAKATGPLELDVGLAGILQ